MRITEYEKESIKTVCTNFDKNSIVYLFGSRIDDTKKGGDIDLLIYSDKLTQRHAGKIKMEIWERIGEQKVDIIIVKDDTNPFVKSISKEKVLI